MLTTKNCLVMLTVVFGLTIAASASSIPVVDNRLIGEWKAVDGGTWIFKADGTGTVDGKVFRFTSFSNKIAVYVDPKAGIFPVSTVVSDYIVSTNGKNFIMHNAIRAVWLELDKKN